jgi:hypothetical protein
VPRIDDPDEDTSQPQLGAEIRREAAQDDPGRHRQRHPARRQQKQHRDEKELRRDRNAGPDLELESERDRVEDDEQGDGEERG